MAHNRFQGYWQASLHAGFIVFFGASATLLAGQSEGAEGAAQAQIQPGASVSCPQQVAFRAKYDLREGAAELATLQALNESLEARLARGPISQDELEKEGLIQFTGVPVTDKSERGQPMPYREALLPKAFTGMYLPTGKKGKPVDPALFDGIVLALPGIGFSASVAKSMFEITGTFNNGRSPGLEVKPGKKLRMLSVPMDAPLNGMAEHAPYGFGHPNGVMAVIRHARLLLSALYPGKQVIMFGRSQGGLNVLEYAAHWDDVAGVIACNPSNPEPEITNACIQRHEDMAHPDNIVAARAEGFSVEFHTRSWTAHADYTPLYTALKYPSRAPSLLLLGTLDTSYPQDLYPQAWQAWANEDPAMRRIASFRGGHNLWMRPRGDGEALFEQVVRAMSQFIAERLEANP